MGATPPVGLGDAYALARDAVLNEISQRNAEWFDDEMEKLDRWAEDLRTSLRSELTEAEAALKEARKAARIAPTLPEKLERQREIRLLETKRDEAWREYDHAGRELDSKKETLLDNIARRLERTTEEKEIFTIRWCIA